MEALIVLELFFIAVLAFAVWLLKRYGDGARRQANLAQGELDRTIQELQRARGQWDAISASIGEGVILISADRRIAYLNPAAKNLLNLPDGAGRALSDAGWNLRLAPLVDQVLDGHAGALSQIIVADERAFQVTVRACDANSGCAAIIVLNEVTELQRLGRARRDFVANISHELRTPVTTLQLLADTVANEIPQNPSAASEWLEKMRGQIDMLNQLTTELMDLALIESGQMPIKLVDTSVAELANQVVELFMPQIERKQIAIDVQVPPQLHALADPDGARRVLGNLLHNAIKFTSPGGHLALRAQPLDDNVEIQIEDDGIGIPARDLPRIFERFYKVDRSRVQGETRSTGLGLAIAKHIVEGHGGKIWAESVEGKGSTFHFTLPAAS